MLLIIPELTHTVFVISANTFASVALTHADYNLSVAYLYHDASHRSHRGSLRVVVRIIWCTGNSDAVDGTVSVHFDKTM